MTDSPQEQAETASKAKALNEDQLSKSELTQDVRPAIDSALNEKRELASEQKAELFSALEARFAKELEHYKRPEGVNFSEVKAALEANPELMWSLARMEETSGEPDIIAVEDDVFVFGDCSAESPNRRNLSYDQAAEMAKAFGVDMMSVKEYLMIAKETEKFDARSGSWLKTTADERKLGHFNMGRLRLEGAGVDHVRNKNIHPDFGWRGVLRVPKA